MPLNMFDPHRVDDPRYQSPRDRGSAQLNGPVEMTIGGLTESQLDAKAAQMRRAEQAKAADNDVVSEIYKLAKAVREAQVSWNDSVEQQRSDMRLDPEVAMSERLKFAESESAQTLSVAGDTLDAWLATKQAAAKRIRDDLVKPGDAAAELRNDRAWQRAKRAIDVGQNDSTGSSTITAARRAIQGADDESLGTLIDQIPPYLESLGLPVEFLDAEIAARVPELAAAQQDLANAERDGAVCKYALGAVRRGIDSGTPVVEAVLVDPAAVEHRIGDSGMAV